MCMHFIIALNGVVGHAWICIIISNCYMRVRQPGSINNESITLDNSNNKSNDKVKFSNSILHTNRQKIIITMAIWLNHLSQCSLWTAVLLLLPFRGRKFKGHLFLALFDHGDHLAVGHELRVDSVHWEEPVFRLNTSNLQVNTNP